MGMYRVYIYPRPRSEANDTSNLTRGSQDSRQGTTATKVKPIAYGALFSVCDCTSYVLFKSMSEFDKAKHLRGTEQKDQKDKLLDRPYKTCCHEIIPVYLYTDYAQGYYWCGTACLKCMTLISGFGEEPYPDETDEFEGHREGLPPGAEKPYEIPGQSFDYLFDEVWYCSKETLPVMDEKYIALDQAHENWATWWRKNQNQKLTMQSVSIALMQAFNPELQCSCFSQSSCCKNCEKVFQTLAHKIGLEPDEETPALWQTSLSDQEYATLVELLAGSVATH